MLLLTQLLYNLPLTIRDTSLLVSSGTNCLNLFQPMTVLIQVTCAKILVKIGRVVLEICSRTDEETGRQTRSSQYSAAVQAGSGVTNLAVDAAVGRLLAGRADEHRRSRARLTPHVGHLVVGRRLGRLVRAGARVGVGDSRTTWPMSRTRRKPRMM